MLSTLAFPLLLSEIEIQDRIGPVPPEAVMGFELKMDDVNDGILI